VGYRPQRHGDGIGWAIARRVAREDPEKATTSRRTVENSIRKLLLAETTGFEPVRELNTP